MKSWPYQNQKVFVDFSGTRILSIKRKKTFLNSKLSDVVWGWFFFGHRYLLVFTCICRIWRLQSLCNCVSAIPDCNMLAKAHLEHSCFCKFHFLFLWSSSIAQACSSDLAISNINITCPTWFVLPTHTFCVSLQLEPCVERGVARKQCYEGFLSFENELSYTMETKNNLWSS